MYISAVTEDVRDKILTEIASLKRMNNNILNIVVSDISGMPIGSDVGFEKETLLSASIAAILSISEKFSASMDTGNFNYIVMDYDNLRLFLFNVKNKYRVLIIARKEAPMGLVLRDVKQFNKRIGEYLP